MSPARLPDAARSQILRRMGITSYRLRRAPNDAALSPMPPAASNESTAVQPTARATTRTPDPARREATAAPAHLLPLPSRAIALYLLVAAPRQQERALGALLQSIRANLPVHRIFDIDDPLPDDTTPVLQIGGTSPRVPRAVVLPGLEELRSSAAAKRSAWQRLRRLRRAVVP